MRATTDTRTLRPGDTARCKYDRATVTILAIVQVYPSGRVLYLCQWPGGREYRLRSDELI